MKKRRAFIAGRRAAPPGGATPARDKHERGPPDGTVCRQSRSFGDTTCFHHGLSLLFGTYSSQMFGLWCRSSGPVRAGPRARIGRDRLDDRPTWRHYHTTWDGRPSQLHCALLGVRIVGSVTIHGFLRWDCIRPCIFPIFRGDSSTSFIERLPRQMAGPGRCDVDTLTFRERKATKHVALPGAKLVPIRSGEPIVFCVKSIWDFMLRIPSNANTDRASSREPRRGGPNTAQGGAMRAPARIAQPWVSVSQPNAATPKGWPYASPSAPAFPL
jgi:hypothetical protein